jgi:hypothetical protein
VLTHFGSKGWNVWAKDGRGLMTVQTNANLHGPLTHMVSSTSPRVSLCLTQFLGTLMAPQTPPHKLLSTLLGQTQWATWTPKSLHPHCHPQPHPLRSLLWLHQVLMPWAPCQLRGHYQSPQSPRGQGREFLSLPPCVYLFQPSNPIYITRQKYTCTSH